jgi:hypothetical protein
MLTKRNYFALSPLESRSRRWSSPSIKYSESMSQTFVKSFTHLKDRPHADRALPMLQRVAVLVKPIMRKHGWIVPVLSEFFPDSPNLVGESLVALKPSSSPQIPFRVE